MSDIKHVGDVMPGAARLWQKTLRTRGVEEGTSSVLQRGQQPGDREEQSEKKVVSFPRRVHAQAKERTDREPSRLSSESMCPICKGAGWLRKDVPYGHPDFCKQFPCACKIRERREKQQRRMIALSAQFGFQRDLVLSSFRRQVNGVQEAFQATKEMIKQLKEWGEGSAEQTLLPPKQWLVFCGPPGVGKTHLAMALVNAGIDAGLVALFATVPDLLDHLRAAYTPESPVVYDDLFTQLKEAEVLVLDDLGAQRSSPWVNEKLFELLNYRYNRKHLTVITLNKQAWIQCDERLRSRLQDKRLVRTIDMGEVQDYRLRAEKTMRQRVPGTESAEES